MAETRPAAARTSLRKRVVEALRKEIESAVWAPGDRLPTEPALTERFGVSRTVVREAIAELRADGLVESRQGVGVFVLEPQLVPAALPWLTRSVGKISEAIEELELRAAVEIEAAGLAAMRASPAQEAEIEAQHNRFSDLVQRNKPTEEADFDFHVAIARATNNPRFEDFLAHLGRRTIPRGKLQLAMQGKGALPLRDAELNAEHGRVAEAIAKRDPDAARAAMRAHLIGSVNRYRALARLAAAAEAPSDL